MGASYVAKVRKFVEKFATLNEGVPKGEFASYIRLI